MEKDFDNFANSKISPIFAPANEKRVHSSIG